MTAALEGAPPGPAAAEIASMLWRHLGLPAPPIELITAEQLPAGFRELLDHAAGMTATLAQRWAEPIDIELLADEISVEERSIYRFVVLRAERSRVAVEIALIRIVLDAFPGELRVRFVEATRPFGSLLAEAGIVCHARPQAFLALKADPFLAAKAAIVEGAPLYGRINHLIRHDGVLLCETVELLPRA